jgi:hypothetical protein
VTGNCRPEVGPHSGPAGLRDVASASGNSIGRALPPGPIPWVNSYDVVVLDRTLPGVPGDENADPFTKTVAVTIGRLRRKLGEPRVIETTSGVGYRLGDPNVTNAGCRPALGRRLWDTAAVPEAVRAQIVNYQVAVARRGVAP